MLDGVSLDQLRTFIAAVDEGSFSAAGRRLRRAQSVVSRTLADMEGQLDVKLFERRARPPVLTDQGRALLAAARAVAGDIDLFKARAKSLANGLEAELSMIVDVMFPVAPFIDAVAAFQGRFPATPLRLDVQAGDTVVEPVLDGRCAVGLMASWPFAPPPQLKHEALLTVEMAMVVSPRHVLATHGEPIPTATLSEHIQLLHLDLSDARAREFGVLSPRVWRLGNLQAKHSFLRAGFGFGMMPLHVVEKDLASGVLVQITAEETMPASRVIGMSAVYRADNPPGPALRWFIDRLKQKDAQRPKAAASTAPPSTSMASKATLTGLPQLMIDDIARPENARAYSP
jgi:DNA-binding transcriptional LysR family regulator